MSAGLQAPGSAVGAVAGAMRRRWSGTFTVDPWGLDPDMAALADGLAAIRWRVEITGGDRIPAVGPAVLVHSRRGPSAPAVLAHAVRRSTGRQLRVHGAPDVAAVGPLLRTLGAVGSHPSDLAGLLDAGEIVAVVLPGRLPPASEGAATALGAGAPLLPVTLSGHEIGRRWSVGVGAPVPNPTGELDLPDVVRHLSAAIGSRPA